LAGEFGQLPRRVDVGAGLAGLVPIEQNDVAQTPRRHLRADGMIDVERGSTEATQEHLADLVVETHRLRRGHRFGSKSCCAGHRLGATDGSLGYSARIGPSITTCEDCPEAARSHAEEPATADGPHNSRLLQVESPGVQRRPALT
jgi:hypothetical protein